MTEESTPYAVACPNHGKVYLTEENYEHQLNNGYDVWRCPVCDSQSWWDDENYEEKIDERV